MSVLRVVVVRTGGFANVRRTGEVDDRAAAARLADAVEAARGRSEDERARDAFAWTFTIVSTDQETTVELADSQLDAAARDLIRQAMRG